MSGVVPILSAKGGRESEVILSESNWSEEKVFRGNKVEYLLHIWSTLKTSLFTF